ncbi:MAG: 30S ribosomal protein S2 [Nanoarchaeota archaeon]|nr:30S ribosomal protein S2 [Nanoarchaeota archaeon]
MVEENKNLLVPLDDYLKAGIHIGTKFKTKYMEPFIYKCRADKLLVLNVESIDSRLSIASQFLSKYEPEEIVVVCRRENGWKAVNAFSDATGIKSLVGRYPPGILTNPKLDSFREIMLMLVTDPWPDKNAVSDAFKMGVPIIALCDTNNESNKLDLVVPCNNKGKKSLGLIYWILAREYLKSRGLSMKDKIDDFIAE